MENKIINTIWEVREMKIFVVLYTKNQIIKDTKKIKMPKGFNVSLSRSILNLI